MFQSTYRCAVLLSLVLPRLAIGSESSPAALTVGTPVLAKHPGVKFRIKDGDTGEMRAGLMLRVQRIKGEWIWLGRGWVQAKEVVPRGIANEYFTRQIDGNPSAFNLVCRSAIIARTDSDGSLKDLRKAVELEPSFAAGYWRRAGQYTLHYQYDRVLDDLDEAIRLDPRFADAYASRGWYWLLVGEYDKAMKDLDVAIRLNPRLALAYVYRALAWAAKGDDGKALTDFQEALAHDPMEAQVHQNMGAFWFDKGDDERVLQSVNEAIRLDPSANSAGSFYYRGRVYALQGDWQKAIADFNLAVQWMPQHFPAGALKARHCAVAAIEQRAYAYYRLGEVDKSNADRIAAHRLQRSHLKDAKDGSGTTISAGGIDLFPARSLEQPSGASSTAVKPIGAAESQQLPTSASNPPASPATSIEAQQRALVLDVAKPLNNSARRAATSTDERYLNGPRAVEQATEACEKTGWQRAEFIDTLAASYAETGDFEAAIRWQTKAIELGTTDSFKAEATRRLELYRIHEPCREDLSGQSALRHRSRGALPVQLFDLGTRNQE
jgi:tetratricopeptide (TPR) repeat protein